MPCSATPSATAIVFTSRSLVLGAVAVLVWTYRVGDIGARAVWNPTNAPL